MNERNEDIAPDQESKQSLHVAEQPHRSPKWVIGGISCALCIVGVSALGIALTLPSPDEALDDRTVVVEGTDLGDESISVPGEVRMLVDTWGNEPPKEGVSPTYAVALASDVAERYFDMKPAGRARVALADAEENFDADYYEVTGDYAWHVTMETEEGEVEVMVDALNGSDCRAWADRDFSARYEGSWLEEFDEWERSGVSPSEKWFGSEQYALLETAKALDNDPPTIEELTNEERAMRIEGKEVKRDLAAKQIVEHQGDPRADAAIAIVNETDLGNGARAVSAEWVGDGDAFRSTSTIDVTLDNGEHLLCYLRGIDSYELMGYERHRGSYLDTMYGNEIARLQAAME